MSEELDNILGPQKSLDESGVSEPEPSVMGIVIGFLSGLSVVIGLLGALLTFAASQSAQSGEPSGPTVAFFMSIAGSGVLLSAIAAHLMQQAVTNKLLYRILKKDQS